MKPLSKNMFFHLRDLGLWYMRLTLKVHPDAIKIHPNSKFPDLGHKLPQDMIHYPVDFGQVMYRQKAMHKKEPIMHKHRWAQKHIIKILQQCKNCNLFDENLLNIMEDRNSVNIICSKWKWSIVDHNKMHLAILYSAVFSFKYCHVQSVIKEYLSKIWSRGSVIF